MIVIYGGAVGQASGRLGADVASKNRYCSYWRKGTSPITSTTSYALEAKAHFAECSTAWQGLSAAQKEAWKQWAQTNPTLNRLGQSITLTGHVAYISLNTRLLRLPAAKISEPPIIPAPAPFYELALTADIGAGNVEVLYSPQPTGAGEGVEVWACVSDSAGINYIQNLLRSIVTSGAVEASPYDIEAAVTARFGALQVDQILHVACRTVTLANGQVSPFLRARATVILTV